MADASTKPQPITSEKQLSIDSDKVVLNVGMTQQSSLKRAMSAEQKKEVSLRVANSMRMTSIHDLPKGLYVSFKDLKYTVYVGSIFSKKTPKVLLDNVRGHFSPGEMTALMGPSGSGKTTLLDVISGRKSTGDIEGEIRYGMDTPSNSFLRRHTGYVEQFDTLVDNLTVY
eukprot:CAMPEP_0202919206 /NCGR_PEP_ID=MMETSP1392-20130828/75279_1 /ASSEMBLY_ACC=CAM_ASM_000868 /TAXON_ID=225041 /ORGANISM="Chlamydomonas chlamydogama, Strain SAG 11-48b" /LENGTH=169 /DNA_ID=CAMNT_0049612479 /DNA_START=238 /DNA_END=744 /DNA_ORIENTATION=+